MNSFAKLFRKTPPTVEEAESALAAAQAEYDQATADVNEALASFGDRLAQTGDGEARKQLGAELEAKRRAQERAYAVRESVEGRLRAARQAEERSFLTQQWDACETALAARDDALARVQSLAEKLAAAITEADEKGVAVWDAIPDALKGKHWQTQLPAFTNNMPAVLVELDVAHRPVDPTSDRKTLHQQAQESTRELLALRNLAKLAA